MSNNSCGGSKQPANSCSSNKKTPSNNCGTTPAKPTTVTVPKELHACMGLNACKGHDRFGNNECAGMGFCATISHACHSLNNCRGQGGCGFYGSAHQQSEPGDNPCAWFGSCAVPINADRLITDGDFKEKTVWKRARTVFEKRMTTQSQRQVGPSPFPDGPPQWWLSDVGQSNSCSASASSNDLSGNSCAVKRGSGSNSCGSSGGGNSCGSKGGGGNSCGSKSGGNSCGAKGGGNTCASKSSSSKNNNSCS